VVSRGGRLLLNVGPDASGRIPEVQRRTLEGVAAWMTALKPYTADRRFPGEDEAAVSVDAGDWCRTWASGDRLVVVADRPEAVRINAPGYEVVGVELPR
jgi:alpha-L-fucosidase